MAVQAAQDAGLNTACHIQGGIDAWKKAMGRWRTNRVRAWSRAVRLAACPLSTNSGHREQQPHKQKTPEHYARRFPGHIRN